MSPNAMCLNVETEYFEITSPHLITAWPTETLSGRRHYSLCLFSRQPSCVQHLATNVKPFFISFVTASMNHFIGWPAPSLLHIYLLCTAPHVRGSDLHVGLQDIKELQSSDFRTRVREKEVGGAALWNLHDPLTAGYRAVLPSLHGLRYQRPLRKRNQSCFERSIITGIKITAVSAATSSYFIKTRLLVEEQRKSRSAESKWTDG